MFKTVHIETDQDIRYGLEILKGPTAPDIIILKIRGSSFMFTTKEAIEMMEGALDDAESAETEDVDSPAQENDSPGKEASGG